MLLYGIVALLDYYPKLEEPLSSHMYQAFKQLFGITRMPNKEFLLKVVLGVYHTLYFKALN